MARCLNKAERNVANGKGRMVWTKEGGKRQLNPRTFGPSGEICFVFSFFLGSVEWCYRSCDRIPSRTSHFQEPWM